MRRHLYNVMIKFIGGAVRYDESSYLSYRP